MEYKLIRVRNTLICTCGSVLKIKPINYINPSNNSAMFVTAIHTGLVKSVGTLCLVVNGPRESNETQVNFLGNKTLYSHNYNNFALSLKWDLRGVA